MGSWAVFLVGAFRQILRGASETLVDQVYEAAAAEAGITVEPAVAKDDTFEYFIADPDLPEEEPEKKTEPVPEPKRGRKPVPVVAEELTMRMKNTTMSTRTTKKTMIITMKKMIVMTGIWKMTGRRW